jgi:hypothetical protein
MTHVPPDLPEASPMVIAESETHVTIVLEISKSTLFRHMRFLENLVDAGTRGEADGG